MAREINLDRLSSEAQWTLRYIAVPLEAGMTKTEIAAANDLTRQQVRRRLERLRREIDQPQRHCEECRKPLPPGSRIHRRYCSNRCTVAAHRDR